MRDADQEVRLPERREHADGLTYAQIMRLDELLSLDTRLAGVHDDILFVTVHQVYELWFKVILHELTSARDGMFRGDAYEARARLRRIATIERTLADQMDVVETIRPDDFHVIRNHLTSSGFHSAQFHEIEILSGLKDWSYLDRLELSDGERDRLRRRLTEPSVWDAFVHIRQLFGVTDLVKLIRDGERPEALDLADALLGHDQGFWLWRVRHVGMVERLIGRKTGTGGSSGATYLRATLEHRFFPELWEARSLL